MKNNHAYPGPREFHAAARAEAERAVHSAAIAGLAVLLLVIITVAYGFFAWQADRAPGHSLKPPMADSTAQTLQTG